MQCVLNTTKEKGVAVNSAQLVNLILAKLGRVEFLDIRDYEVLVCFRWGHNDYAAVFQESRLHGHINVYRLPIGMEPPLSDFLRRHDDYSRWVEGVLNGKKRDADGNLS